MRCRLKITIIVDESECSSDDVPDLLLLTKGALNILVVLINQTRFKKYPYWEENLNRLAELGFIGLTEDRDGTINIKLIKEKFVWKVVVEDSTEHTV